MNEPKLSSSTTTTKATMEPFATHLTPSGFPMPDLPNGTQSIDSPPDCQETDVDEYVREIISTYPNWTAEIYNKHTVKMWTKDYGRDKQKIRDTAGLVWYAVEECKWRHQQWRDRPGTPVAINKNGLVLAKDNGISQELRTSMMEDIRRLTIDDEMAKTSTMAPHPRYSQVALQIVHPSLYCYEKGVTAVLPNVGAEATSMPKFSSFLGVKGMINTDRPASTPRSGRKSKRIARSDFQWLPSEFFVSSADSKSTLTGQKPKCHINSYINNLHPMKYKGLYDKIGELFVEALPVLEELLTEIDGGNGKIRKQLPRFESKERQQTPTHKPWISKKRWEAIRSEPKKSEKEPRIPKFKPPSYTAQATSVNLHDRPLQVIVKIIQWNLTPDNREWHNMTSEERRERCNNPTNYFDEGHWHVEGTHDERIVASACCYLDATNVSESNLEFRDGSVGSFGCELGSVSTTPGRFLVWPNYLHHKTGGFGLKDKKRPGSRTLCCFHLIDPTIRIRSTATVPPQQQSWVLDMCNTAMSRSPILSISSSNSVVPSKIRCFMAAATSAAATATATTVSTALTTSRTSDAVSKDDGSDGDITSTLTYSSAIERRDRLSKERRIGADVIADALYEDED